MNNRYKPAADPTFFKRNNKHIATFKFDKNLPVSATAGIAIQYIPMNTLGPRKEGAGQVNVKFKGNKKLRKGIMK